MGIESTLCFGVFLGRDVLGNCLWLVLGFENSRIKIKDFFFFSHFLRPSLFSNCRSRIESKNTLAHLVKVDDCFELRLHWGRELQVGNGRRIGRRFVWFCYGFASFLFYRWWLSGRLRLRLRCLERGSSWRKPNKKNKETNQEREQQNKKEESKQEARIKRKKFGKVNGLSS